VAYVPTQAPNGYSQSLLTYTFNDVNNIKGVTQYRLRQEDIDAKVRYSVVRAVRGEGQIGKTIVYPNPSLDGKVNVVFEDASVKRDVAVIDLSGRVIRQFKAIANNNVQIDNLGSGVYTIRISVPETGEVSVEKVVVSKR
jgi:hypothetical protein